MPSIIATIKVKEDKIEEAKKALSTMCRAVLDSEPGTLAYVCHQRADDPTAFVFYEKYESEEAVKAHQKGLPAKSAGLAGIIAGPPEVLVLEEI